jgi:hypothetical protein
LIEKTLAQCAAIPFAHGDVEIQTVFDRRADHYLVVLVGREDDRRVHGCLVHIDIRDGKVWIQRDGTEEGIAQALLDGGIPKDRIVLGFYSPRKRQLTEFAVA